VNLQATSEHERDVWVRGLRLIKHTLDKRDVPGVFVPRGFYDEADISSCEDGEEDSDFDQKVAEMLELKDDQSFSRQPNSQGDDGIENSRSRRYQQETYVDSEEVRH
jgi:hypothetical protein